MLQCIHGLLTKLSGHKGEPPQAQQEAPFSGTAAAPQEEPGGVVPMEYDDAKIDAAVKRAKSMLEKPTAKQRKLVPQEDKPSSTPQTPEAPES
ncbi:MAG: hypothetical protein AAGJ31_14525 [Verrucomicrobiota bacterium]